MATAVRFVLGKLGIRRSSSVSVANMVDVIKTLNVNQVMFPIPVLAPSRLNLNLSYSSGRYRNCDETCQPLPHLPLEYWEKYRSRSENIPSRWVCASSPEIVAYSRFAVEEFNKEKNAQLQYVRGVCPASKNEDCVCLLTLEAVDADHVVKIYQTIIKDDRTGDPPKLNFCGLWEYEPDSDE